MQNAIKRVSESGEALKDCECPARFYGQFSKIRLQLLSQDLPLLARSSSDNLLCLKPIVFTVPSDRLVWK